MERLQKLMAQANIGSRRECEKIIEQGRVKVNGTVATLGDKADPAQDKIEVNGRVLNIEQVEYIYVAINKPKGVISSLEDEMDEGRKTVRDLVPLPGHLYPVGRLDKQSEGLMLMTNDGDLAHKLTHPRYGHEKVYRVVVNGELSDISIHKWENGMPLDGSMTLPAKIEVVRRQKAFTQLQITLREGRKRQIRRMANMLGHGVKELVRENIGPLTLGNLKSGQWRHLRPDEVAALRKSVAEKPAEKRRRRRPTKRPSSYYTRSGSRPNDDAKKSKKSPSRKRGKKRG
jgi:pseudouridine synthase